MYTKASKGDISNTGKLARRETPDRERPQLKSVHLPPTKPNLSPIPYILILFFCNADTNCTLVQ